MFMRIAIDASNLLDGGGITHLKELLLEFSNINNTEFIVMVGSNSPFRTYAADNIKIEKIDAFNRNVFFRNYWLYSNSEKWLIDKKVDILFNPGGGYIGSFKPYVTMCRNMLIFQSSQRKLYGFSKTFLRLKILELVHSKSIKNASGTIFISEFAEKYVSKNLTELSNSVIIRHGVSNLFNIQVKNQKAIESYSFNDPFKLLYVSIIDVYKHHIEVSKAVIRLRGEGYPIEINFIGGNYAPALEELNSVLSELDPEGRGIHLLGKMKYAELQEYYRNSDAFVFASSCENMPNILIEAMRSGLPIACSKSDPMPEFLKDGGHYFEPESSNSIYNCLLELITDHSKRSAKATLSKAYSEAYSWKKCADETMTYLTKIAYKNN